MKLSRLDNYVKQSQISNFYYGWKNDQHLNWIILATMEGGILDNSHQLRTNNIFEGVYHSSNYIQHKQSILPK
jgi:hypothetical protein